jgi:hypothetical protein
VRLFPVMRNRQALDRLVRTIEELCARRLDRIFLPDVRQQNDDRSGSLGLHSAVVGKYIDVSILLFAWIGRMYWSQR